MVRRDQLEYLAAHAENPNAYRLEEQSTHIQKEDELYNQRPKPPQERDEPELELRLEELRLLE